MNTNQNNSLRRTGYIAFLLSGICSIASGVVVSILQENYQFSFGFTGTLLSFLSIGNMAASFIIGILTAKLGLKKSILLLITGFPIGYILMTLSGVAGVLCFAFLLVGLAKGGALNTCTVLVGQNTTNKPQSMTIMHSCYALGALSSPFLISALARVNSSASILCLAAIGVVMFILFAIKQLPGATSKKDIASNYQFLKLPEFWLATALVFCQNAAEQSVNGWLVTYFKNSQILSGTLAAYTITIMWGATLAARLLIAFVFKVEKIYRATMFMGIGCLATYLLLISQTRSIPAVIALFAFAFSLAGVNPLAIAGTGKILSPQSMSILLPISSIGAIVMPMIIGLIADSLGLKAGMAANLVPCAGIFILSYILSKK